jgi:hypothetical protein
MRHSLYDPAGSDPGPDKRDEAADTIQERDRPWTESLTVERHRHYKAIAMSAISFFLRHQDEIELIADAVFEELCANPNPPSIAQVEGYIWTLARSRAIDHIRSLRYKNWKKWVSLFLKDENGEEYERTERQLLVVDGPEEHFFQQLEEEEYNGERRTTTRPARTSYSAHQKR